MSRFAPSIPAGPSDECPRKAFSGPDAESLRLKFLEAVLLELESPAVLGHVANELDGGAFGEDGLDVESDLNIGTDDAGEMAQNLEADLGGVVAGTDWVEVDGSMEPTENGRERQLRRHAASCLRAGSRGGRSFTPSPGDVALAARR